MYNAKFKKNVDSFVMDGVILSMNCLDASFMWKTGL